MRMLPILTVASAMAVQSWLPAPRSIPPTVSQVAEGILLFEALPKTQERLDNARWFLQQKINTHHTLADLTPGRPRDSRSQLRTCRHAR
jgi:hypothetical protein